jgi:hypothetical protein
MNYPVLHITRGTLATSTLDDARALHNSFIAEGPQPGIEVARSLGDLSHLVYVPAQTEPATRRSDASTELLFVDLWADTNGMEAFFSHPAARQAGDRLFSSRGIRMVTRARRLHLSHTRPRRCDHALHRDDAGTSPFR